MKKGIVLTLAFLITCLISIVILSYIFGNAIKLSTIEFPNPKTTYFLENIKHNFGFKFFISLIISAIVVGVIDFTYSRKKD